MKNNHGVECTRCINHADRFAEMRCKDCDRHLCMVCAMEHNGEHRLVLLQQEAIRFARSVLSSSFSPKAEQANCEAALRKLDLLKDEYTELRKLVSSADKRLGEVDEELGHEIETLRNKSENIETDLNYLKGVQEEELAGRIRSMVKHQQFSTVCRQQQAFLAIKANRKSVSDCDIVAQKAASKARRVAVKELIAAVDKGQRKMQSYFEECKFEANTREEDKDQERRALREGPETANFVGRIAALVLMFNIETRRNQSFKPKKTTLHECCEGVEVRGRMFITGGKEDSKDVFELALSGVIVPKTAMKQGRYNHALCQLGSCALYTAGGICRSAAISNCEKYSIGSDVWTELPALNENKHNGAMCVLAERYVFHIGGGQAGHKHLSSTIEVLDTLSEDRWEVLEVTQPKWVPCECVGCVGINRNEVLIFGGWKKHKNMRASCFVYNHERKELKKLPGKMKRKGAFFYRFPPVVREGKVYAMSPDDVIHTFEIKDRKWDTIAPNEWKERLSVDLSKPLALTGRVLKTLWVYEAGQAFSHAFDPKVGKIVDFCEGVAIGSTLYLVGGENSSRATNAIDVSKYTGEVESKAELNVGRYNHAVEKVDSTWIFCCGGYMGKDLLDHCEKYSIEKNRWIEIPRLSEAKQNCALCACNGTALYCFGGGKPGHSVLFGTIERLDLAEEDAGWIQVVPRGNGIGPIECLGTLQMSPHTIMLFGGWKADREESGKCYEYDMVNNVMRSLPNKLKCKTGFYYSIKSVVQGRKMYLMDPGFNIHVFDKMRQSWELIQSEEWKESDKKDETCTVF